MANKKGEGFERLTEDIYVRLIRDEKFEKVDRNVRINGVDGERQIDILLTTHTMGLEIKTIVECKDYNKKVDVARIDAIDSKMKDVGASRAVVVASRGFTSGAISKARRLNISLYTAHEALSDRWGIDVEVPIIVYELTPRSISVEGDFWEKISGDFEFYRDKFLVNDQDLYSLICQKWNNGELNVKSTPEIQQALFESFPEPLYLRDKNGNKIEFKGLRITLESTMKGYLGNINQIENTKLLKDIVEDKMTFFLNTAPIKDYKRRFKVMTQDEMPTFNGLTIIVGTALQIKNVRGQLVNFKH